MLRSPTLEEEIIKEERLIKLSATLERALNTLTVRERQVLDLRSGWTDNTAKTKKRTRGEIAVRLGLSVSRVQALDLSGGRKMRSKIFCLKDFLER